MTKSINCGNCKGTHASVQDVKACYGTQEPVGAAYAEYTTAEGKKAVRIEAYIANPTPAPTGNPATEKQVAFVRKLAGERTAPVAGATSQEAFIIARYEDLLEGSKFVSTKEASAVIEWLLALPKNEANTEPPEGVHRIADGTIYKVYAAVHGSGRLVAKRLIVKQVGERKYESEWYYEGRKPFKNLSEATLLSQEAAAEFGKLYGFCVRCGLTLTRDESLHVGYGKTCAGHQGWWYPTKAELRELTAAKATAIIERGKAAC